MSRTAGLMDVPSLFSYLGANYVNAWCQRCSLLVVSYMVDANLPRS